MKIFLHQWHLLFILPLLCFQGISQQSKEQAFREIYRTQVLVINQIAPNSYQHISYLPTNDFGLVPCNGLIVRDKNEVIIFDTPTNDQGAEELIQWVNKTLGCKIKAIIPTHFHDDGLGGLNAFIQQNIPSWANFKTLELAKQNGYAIPQYGFKDSITLALGKEKVLVKFFGEGHTQDNVVGYFSKDRILFGGCLIKEMNATKGYLGDANVNQWSSTVEQVKNAFPQVKWVVPGHGKVGDSKLLDYTIDLFK
ncbi:subclass B1 metallo-beta-lactamase [Aquirufa rosea]|uniref:beta-lactamase n=1 Tax=Aquirufa rosea TaxID=2509241 RepID=A0A4Q1BZ92_9BACT|nr:subclass B1 metallo-beta-lactamase [Aquirufa rosea]RXK48833.1 subclass B1 metallo-beta-lactamase [Aquirufa rosea]